MKLIGTEPLSPAEQQARSRERRSTAYAALKYAAVDAGYMDHMMDTAKFTELMEDIQNGDVEVILKKTGQTPILR